MKVGKTRKTNKIRKLLIAIIVIVVGAIGAVALLQWFSSTREIQPTILSNLVDSEEVVPNLSWPNYGQTSIATENQGIVATHGDQTPHPTASTAKVIAVLAILEKKPLKLGETGEKLTLTEADVKLYDDYVAKNGSNTQVSNGLELTEYQALQSILLASSNNMADSLAIWAFSSLEEYSKYANDMVERYGTTQTTIGNDASGFDPTTLSTSDDMALLSLKALENPVISEITSQQKADIPLAGTIYNSNALLSKDSGIIGIKTGETVEAGGNFLLGAKYESNGESQNVVVVVFGADEAKNAIIDSYTLYKSISNSLTYAEIIPAGTSVAEYKLLNGTTARAVNNQAIRAWTWAGKVSDPKVSVNSITSQTANCSEVGAVSYGAVSVPVALSRDNQTCQTE